MTPKYGSVRPIFHEQFSPEWYFAKQFTIQAHLWSMYPPQQTDGNTNVIQINTLDLELEDSILNPNLCPALTTLYEQMTKRPEWIAKEQECASLKSYLQSIFNQTIPWNNLMDNLISRQCHGLTYPAGINQTIVDEITNINTWQQVYTWTDPVASKLGYLNLMLTIN
jgi:hypothetical protein